MNREGSLDGNCKISQNGRRGLFFVVENETLAKSVRQLLRGETGSMSPDEDDDGDDED